MMGEWREVTVGEIASSARNALVGGPFGSNLVSRDYVESGVPVIRGQNMGERCISGEFVYVTPSKAASLEANIARPGDIVFTQRGTLGQVAIVPVETYERYLVSQSQMKLTVDREVADSLFIYYVFSSDEQKAYIRQNSIQTGVPHTNLGILRNTPILLPPLNEQRAIAHILGTLDDKIELNRKMNQTLEAMARAIFKSWFVDFDPVRAKVDGRDTSLPADLTALFPGSLKDSELGEIPTGWRVGTVKDLVSLSRDSVNPSIFPAEQFYHYSLPAFDEGQVPKVELGAEIKSNKFIVSPVSVLLSKLNPRFPRVWLPSIQSEKRSICSTEFLVAHPKTGISRKYLFSLFTSQTFVSTFATLVTGTSGSHQRVKPEGLIDMQVIIPPDNLIAAYTKIVKPLIDQSNRNIYQSRTLAASRDALLPKLLLGEIRVKTGKAE